MSRYGALCLTKQCRPILKGQQHLALRKPSESESSSKAKQKQSSRVRPQDQPLWEALRTLRKTLAEAQDVPAYVIFNDDSLLDMVKKRPETLGQFDRVLGVGQAKRERYGQAFIDVILDHPLSELLDNRLSDTVNQTLMLYEQSHNVDAIAQQRGVTLNTIYTHLAQAIELGILEVREVIDVDDSLFSEVVFLLESMEDESKGRLKPIYDELDGAVDYGLLRCIQAAVT
jgi:ATP-dependent DNA helicase RecQ